MTCPDCTHPRITLVDGTVTCTWSEAWRHETEARMVVNMPTLAARRKYLFDIYNKRGEKAHVELRSTVAKLWDAQPAVANTGSQ